MVKEVEDIDSCVCRGSVLELLEGACQFSDSQQNGMCF